MVSAPLLVAEIMESVSVLIAASLPQILTSILLLPLRVLWLISEGFFSALGCNNGFVTAELMAFAGLGYALIEDLWPGLGVVALSISNMMVVLLNCMDPRLAPSTLVEDFVLRSFAASIKANS